MAQPRDQPEPPTSPIFRESFPSFCVLVVGLYETMNTLVTRVFMREREKYYNAAKNAIRSAFSSAVKPILKRLL